MELEVLGPLAVTVSGQAVPLGSGMRRRLLGVLACHANIPVETDRLAAALWIDPPPSAANNLRQYVYRLRQLVGDRIVRDRQGYRLIVHDGELDVHRFEALCAEAGREACDEEIEERLTRALALWRGPAFADVADAALVRPVAERLEEARMVAIERRIEAGLRLGRHEGLLAELAALVAENPLRERLRGQWMLALYRSGRQAEALETYQEGRRSLAAELGHGPGEELRRLEQAILERDPSLHPGPEPAPPPAGAAGPAELPMAAAAFTGRRAELVRLRDLLLGDAADRPAIAAIVGPGGVGKSALAIQAGHEVAYAYPDGRLYVNLHGSTPGAGPLEPAEALGRLMRSLGIGEAPADLDEAAGRFRSATSGRRLLIVLDNALDVAQVRQLIPASSSCAVLITARRTMAGLDGVVHERLDTLPEKEAGVLLTRLAGPEAAGVEDAAAEVIHHCDHLPLAICVAAARLNARPGWTMRTLAGRLRSEVRRLTELEADDRGVRASFAVSYRELEHPQRRMFRLLGLMDGFDIGVPVAAALAGVEPDAAREILDHLADAQLLEEHAPGRYRLHDLLHLFARECAGEEETPEDRAQAVRRALNCHLATARAANTVIGRESAQRPNDGPAVLIELDVVVMKDRDDVYAWAEEEYANFAALVRQAAAIGEDGPDLAILFVSALEQPLVQRGRRKALLSIGEEALDIARSTGDPFHEAVANEVIGGAQSRVGDLDAALFHLRRAREAYRSIGHSTRETIQLTGIAIVLRSMGLLDEAIRQHHEAIELNRRLGRGIAVASNLDNLGITYRRMGRTAEAVDTHAEAVTIYERAGDFHRAAVAIMYLADTQRLARDPEVAIANYLRAQEVRRRTEATDTYYDAQTWWGLGMCYHELGDGELARRCRSRASAILHHLGLIGTEERRALESAAVPDTPEAIRRNL